MMFPPLDKKSNKDIQKAREIDIHYISSLISNVRHITALKDAGIQQYRVRVAYDENTCKTCAKMDGKVFDVKKAITGRNCPPFHKGCRCSVSTVRDLPEKSQQRGSGADGKTVLLPGRMSYSDWVAWKKEGFPAPVEVWYQKYKAKKQ